MKKTFTNSSGKLAAVTLLSAGMFGVATAYAQQNIVNPSASAIIPITQSVETGPVLDVIPYVLSDGYTINLALIPSDTEFGGYADPIIPNFNTGGGSIGNLNVVQIPTVYPYFTVRQIVTTVNVWDNQTVVLGGLITSKVNATKDKLPIVGDLPLVGRLFQSQSKQTTKNNLMIFVTATIVDPAGTRVHTDDELPFAGSNVPDQPKENVAPTMTEKTVPLSDLHP